MIGTASGSTQWWLMKSEPSTYSIDDLARDGITPWEGVRNYQARNFMRDQMRIGDGVFFYHSSCPEPGIAGLAEVASPAHPDPSALDPASPCHVRTATPNTPIWCCVDVRFVRRLPRLLALAEIRAIPALADLWLLRRGLRLSIQPVTPAHARTLLARISPRHSTTPT